MDKAEILILPEADEFLSLLPEILVKNSYYIWRESAERLVNDILEFMLTIPNLPHYTLTEKAANYFRRYGSDLLYVFFIRKSSPNTTWYIFFSKCDNRYLIRYITNNHKDGAYIR